MALPIWLVGWYVVHLGAVYDAAVRNTVLLAVEHGFLIAIGLLFWWPVLCDVPRAVSTLVRLGYVFAAFVLSAFLGLALTFSPPIYDYYESLPERLWGISAEQDQNLGGILMSTEQALVFFAAIVWLLVRLFREEAEAERRLAEEQRAAGYASTDLRLATGPARGPTVARGGNAVQPRSTPRPAARRGRRPRPRARGGASCGRSASRGRSCRARSARARPAARARSRRRSAPSRGSSRACRAGSSRRARGCRAARGRRGG